MADERARAGMNEPASMKRFAPFACKKGPAVGSRAMVVANHPLASAAGADALYAGELGSALVEALSRTGGLVAREDLGAYRVIERAPIRGAYRGFEILGPSPPASSGVHVAPMPRATWWPRPRPSTACSAPVSGSRGPA